MSKRERPGKRSMENRRHMANVLSGIHQRYTEEDYVNAIRECASIVGHRPYSQEYHRVRTKLKKTHWPSHARIAQVYGWNNLLAIAGYDRKPLPKGMGKARWTLDELAGFIRQAGDSLGDGLPPSATQYNAWASQRRGEVPNLATIRQRFPSWMDAINYAYPEL